MEEEIRQLKEQLATLQEAHGTLQRRFDDLENERLSDISAATPGTRLNAGHLNLGQVLLKHQTIGGDGVAGILIETIPGSGIFEYLFGSSGFIIPGGTVDNGTLTLKKDDSNLIIQGKSHNDYVVFGVTSESGAGTLDLDGYLVPGTGTPSQNRTIKVQVNGTTYYLLASTSAT